MRHPDALPKDQGDWEIRPAEDVLRELTVSYAFLRPEQRLAKLGVDLIPEDTTGHGRIDLTVRHRGRVRLLELKVSELSQPGRALGQLKARNYVFLVGRGQQHLEAELVEKAQRADGILQIELGEGLVEVAVEAG